MGRRPGRSGGCWWCGRSDPAPSHRVQDAPGEAVAAACGREAAKSQNDPISTLLYISEATTKTHVSNLLMKLGARARVQLVIIAYEAGLTPGRIT